MGEWRGLREEGKWLGVEEGGWDWDNDWSGDGDGGPR